MAYGKIGPNHVVAAEPQAARLGEAIREDTGIPEPVPKSTTSN
ncbi:hypothetical protein [Actinacidiphila sp. bgisy160]